MRRSRERSKARIGDTKPRLPGPVAFSTGVPTPEFSSNPDDYVGTLPAINAASGDLVANAPGSHGSLRREVGRLSSPAWPTGLIQNTATAPPRSPLAGGEIGPARDDRRARRDVLEASHPATFRGRSGGAIAVTWPLFGPTRASRDEGARHQGPPRTYSKHGPTSLKQSATGTRNTPVIDATRTFRGKDACAVIGGQGSSRGGCWPPSPARPGDASPRRQC
jgi:hypothetical protein